MAVLLLLLVLGGGAFSIWWGVARARRQLQSEAAFYQELKMHYPTQDILSVAGRHGLMCFCDATVQTVQTWSETHVSGSSSGGGGYISQGSGYISAPSISVSSHTVTTIRVFVKDDLGEEWHFDAGKLFAAKTGDRVRVYFVRGPESNKLILAKNVTNQTEQSWELSHLLPTNAWFAVALLFLIVIEPILIYIRYTTPNPPTRSGWEFGMMLAIVVTWIVTTIIVMGIGWIYVVISRAFIRNAMSEQLGKFVSRNPPPRRVAVEPNA